MEGYEPKGSQDCLIITKKNLRIIIEILAGNYRLNYHLRNPRISKETVFCLFCK